ncbi:MAG: DUF3237 domain-containing protein [Christensenellaceae bacterium]|nr:DUF3237 domain-containing protein [Christensenellaceae bacterium]
MSIRLVPFCKVVVTPGPPVDLGGTPSGRRIMVNIVDSVWEGETFNAKLKSGTAAGDWMIIGADGTAMIDIRLTLETHDGALVYVSYYGRRNFTEVEKVVDAPVYIAPLFETCDPRYEWIN